PRKSPATEIPAVELLQKPRGAVLTELAHRFADEQDELSGDLLARRPGRPRTVDDLAQRPWISLRAAPDHHRGRAGGREHALRPRTRRHVAGGDHGDVHERNQLGLKA